MRRVFDLYEYLQVSGSQAAQKRKASGKAGIHVPAFLQADICVQCNLSCPGCYKRFGHTEGMERLLNVAEWDALFREAEQLGIRFIFLTGGEPLLRCEVLERAARYQNIWFLVFTNGTLMDRHYYQFFSDHRNLVPVLCLESCSDIDVTQTGKSSYLYGSLMHTMDSLSRRDIVYAVSVALTMENWNWVVTMGFLEALNRRKCNGVVYVEYGLEEAERRNVLLNERDRDRVEEELSALQKEFHDMVFFTFPREGRISDKSLLQGQRIFQVTADGFVCPRLFRRVHGKNIKEYSLQDILKDDLFE